MKKSLLSVVALMVSASAINAYAVSGKVNFTGEIVASTCNVVSSDQTKDVYIGKYPTNAFVKSGDVTASKSFSISLEKCESGQYSLRFDGPTVEGNPNLLSVAAKGVGIEILDSNDKIIPINDSSDNSPWVTVTSTGTDGDQSGTATFNLKARYKSYADQVDAGDGAANATFTIEYK